MRAFPNGYPWWGREWNTSPFGSPNASGFRPPFLAVEPCRGLGVVPGFVVEAIMHPLPAGHPIVLGDITQVFGPLLVHLWCLHRAGGAPPVPQRGPLSRGGRRALRGAGSGGKGRDRAKSTTKATSWYG